MWQGVLRGRHNHQNIIKNNIGRWQGNGNVLQKLGTNLYMNTVVMLLAVQSMQLSTCCMHNWTLYCGVCASHSLPTRLLHLSTLGALLLCPPAPRMAGTGVWAHCCTQSGWALRLSSLLPPRVGHH
jgi:hypothetical protein